MEKGQHIQPLLLAYLDGALPPPQRDALAAHLAGCPDCEGELSLLREGRAVLPAGPSSEPRPGFALRVASNARARPARRLGLGVRWALGGGFAVAGLAAAAALIAVGHRPQPSEDLRVARRLELYEDMAVMQHQQALEDLDVVAVLHTLPREARP